MPLRQFDCFRIGPLPVFRHAAPLFSGGIVGVGTRAPKRDMTGNLTGVFDPQYLARRLADAWLDIASMAPQSNPLLAPLTCSDAALRGLAASTVGQSTSDVVGKLMR